jgi:hypothetical protein
MDVDPPGEQQFIDAWRQAGDDLAIEVVAPFVLSVEDENLRFVAHLPTFGHRNGMLVLRRGATVDGKKLTDLGYGYSLLGSSYSAYNRSLFVETLNDWGWQGESGAAPNWYTGEPWG